jgi:O-antigen/teichoic acid export membrane protein
VIVSQLILLALGLISSMVTARWLSVADRGHLATLQTLSGLGLQISNLGGPAAVLYLASQFPERTGALARASLTLCLLAGLPMAMGLAVLPTAWLGDVPRIWLVTAMAFLPIHLLLWLWRQLLIGRDRSATASWADTLARSLVFAWLLALGVTNRVDVLWLVMGGGAIVAAQVAWWGWQLRRMCPVWPVWPEVWQIARPYALAGFGSGLLAALILRLDNLMVVAWCNASELGLYAVAKIAMDTLGMVPVMLGPMLAAAVAGRSDRLLTTVTIARRLAWPSLAVLGMLGITASWWMPTFFGTSYRAAVPVLIMLLPGIWAYLFGSLWLYHLAGDGNPRLVVMAPLAGLLALIVAGSLLIPGNGAWGAAVAASCGFLAQLVALALGLRQRYRLPLPAAIGFGRLPAAVEGERP